MQPAQQRHEEGEPGDQPEAGPTRHGRGPCGQPGPPPATPTAARGHRGRTRRERPAPSATAAERGAARSLGPHRRRAGRPTSKSNRWTWKRARPPFGPTRPARDASARAVVYWTFGSSPSRHRGSRGASDGAPGATSVLGGRPPSEPTPAGPGVLSTRPGAIRPSRRNELFTVCARCVASAGGPHHHGARAVVQTSGSGSTSAADCRPVGAAPARPRAPRTQRRGSAPDPHALWRHLEHVAGPDGREELDVAVRREQPLVAVGPDAHLRGHVAEQPEAVRAVDEVAAVVGVRVRDVPAVGDGQSEAGVGCSLMPAAAFAWAESAWTR